MVTIYCIEDINDLKYVGSTKQTLKTRLTRHRYFKNECSSKKLDLDNCKIHSLESCNELNRKERERYWINKIYCVNTNKLNGFDKNRHKKNKREWNKQNKHKKKEYNKDNYLFRSKKVVNGCYEFIKMLEEY